MLGEVEGETIEVADEEEDRGTRKMMKMSDPKEPSEEEKKEHMKTHLPFRNWCRHCIRGRGKEAAHRKQEGCTGLPEVHFDYAFMGDEADAGNTVPMLVARVRGIRMTLATAVPRKSAGTFVVSRVIAFLKEVGIEKLDIIAKSDQEPAIVSLVDAIGRQKAILGGRWVVECSPVGSHASNGVVERAIQSVEGQVRVLKSALEERWKVKVPAASAVIPWLMEYAAYLLNRFEVGHDGRTAYERCKGKTAKCAGIEFGEGVLWRRKPVGGALGKLSVMWEDGVFLGVKGRTGEYVIGDAKGVWKTRTIQRKPMEERWSAENAEKVKWVPWKVNEADEKEDGEMLEVIRMDEWASEEPGREREFETAPRRAKISKRDLEVHGYTVGCEGCKAVLGNKTARAHSEKCRKRVEELMKDDPKVKGATERQSGFISKVIEAEDRKRTREDENEVEESEAKKKQDELNEVRDNMTMSELLAEARGEETEKKRKAEQEIEREEVPKVGRPASGSGYSAEEKKRALEGGERQAAKESAKLAKREEQVRNERRRREEEVEVSRKQGRVESKRGEKRKSEGGGKSEDEADDAEIGDIEGKEEDGIEVNDEEEEVNEWDVGEEDYVDQRTGLRIDPGLASKARAEEVKYMREIGLYEEVPVEECWRKTGKGPTTTKWVDVNKGSEEVPDIRCRLVARDFKPKGEKDRSDLFAATPPLEAKKLLFQLAVNENGRRRRSGGNGIKVMLIDVKKAHLYGMVKEGEEAYIQLPGEAGQEGRCGRLRRWLYGMRPAAGAWEDEYSEKLEAMGFKKGKAVPTAFYNEEKRVRCVVHGDDFTFVGERGPLEEVAKGMRKHYELKVRAVLGDEARDDKEVTILNRKLKWVGDSLEYEADDRHVKEILEYFGLTEESKGLDIPIVKEEEAIEDVEGDELWGPEVTEFRAMAARANYLAPDRLDIQFAAKEICRDMAKPRVASMAKLKRLARYLLRFRRGTIHFRAQPEADDTRVEVYSDSDWAGCRRTRKSTSGGVLMVGGGVLKTWSGTQATVALSSGEAEYNAVTRASAEGLGMVALMGDLGWPSQLRVWIDSSAAKSIASRMGLGKVRHLEVKFLWLQEAVRRKRLELRKVRGDCNPADWLTKPQSFGGKRSALAAYGLQLKKEREE